MTETPAAALEWRVSELERQIGEPPGGEAAEPGSLFVSLSQAARALQEAVCPEEAENRTRALQRAHALHRNRYALPATEAAVNGARERLEKLELELGELAAMSGVLDGSWRERPFLNGEVKDAIKNVEVAAEEAEAAVREESRAVDQVLMRYNAMVGETNNRFERLATLLRAIERKEGKREA